MKNLMNLTPSLVLGIAMLVASPISACAQDSAPLDLAAASAAVDTQVQQDLSAQLRAALEAPRSVHTRRSPSVEVSEMSEQAESDMYVVVVEASRLPPLDIVTAQTRQTVSIQF